MTDAFYEQLALWSEVVGAIAFVILLVWTYARFIRPGIAAAQERTNAELAESVRRRDAAREQVDAVRQALSTADEEAQAILERGKRDAERERVHILDEARAEGQRVVRNANGELDRGRAAARDRLRGELLRQAMRIAHEAAEKIDAKTNDQLIGGVLSTLERDGGGS